MINMARFLKRLLQVYGLQATTSEKTLSKNCRVSGSQEMFEVARGLTAEVQAAWADWPLDHDGAERYNLFKSSILMSAPEISLEGARIRT